MQERARKSDMEQVRLALEHGSRADRFRGLVLLFWGLILAKCLYLEWAIRAYEAPVDSLYLWVPTLAFGFLGTLIYAQREVGAWSHIPLTGRLVAAIWAGCAVALVLLGMVGTQSGVLAPFHLPAVVAVVMGLGFFIHGTIDHRPWYRLAAFGWWAGSLFLFTLHGPESLAWLATFLLLFQVGPGVLNLLTIGRKPPSTATGRKGHRASPRHEPSAR